MPEAVNAVIRYLLDEVKLDFLLMGHLDWNQQPARVIEKCGTMEHSEESILFNGDL